MEKSKVKKVKAPKPPKEKLSESELAEKQAARMLKDMDRLQATQSKSADQKEVRSSVDLWKDSDFFFSVVFQSSTQKYEFLEQFSIKFKVGIDSAKSSDDTIQIMNGLLLAEKLGFKLSPEKVVSYPYPNLELKDMVLDTEEI